MCGPRAFKCWNPFRISKESPGKVPARRPRRRSGRAGPRSICSPGIFPASVGGRLGGLEPQDRAVQVRAAVADLGDEVEVAVLALHDVPEPDAELGQHRDPLLCAASPAERNALHLLAGERRNEQVVPPLRKRASVVEREAGRSEESTRLNSSHVKSSYAVFCLKKKTTERQ